MINNWLANSCKFAQAPHWYFTFGRNSPFRNNYVVLYGDKETCTNRMLSVFGRAWSMVYDEFHFQGQADQYNYTKLDIEDLELKLRKAKEVATKQWDNRWLLGPGDGISFEVAGKQGNVINPFLDEVGKNEVKPIEYYGEDFLNSGFMDLNKTFPPQDDSWRNIQYRPEVEACWVEKNCRFAQVRAQPQDLIAYWYGYPSGPFKEKYVVLSGTPRECEERMERVFGKGNFQISRKQDQPTAERRNSAPNWTKEPQYGNLIPMDIDDLEKHLALARHLSNTQWQHFKENGKSSGYEFVMSSQGQSVVNPWLDQTGKKAVNPIQHYGQAFLESKFMFEYDMNKPFSPPEDSPTWIIPQYVMPDLE